MSCSVNASSNPPRVALRPTTVLRDLEEDILCRLPLKLLVQLSCTCKSWNSLVSDRNFAKKNLEASRKLLNRQHLLLSSRNPVGFYRESYWNSPLSSVFNAVPTGIPLTQLSFPPVNFPGFGFVDSCDGILCFEVNAVVGEDLDKRKRLVLLWNPSVRRFKEICLLENLDGSRGHNTITLSFGYDISTDDYKVVAVSSYLKENEEDEEDQVVDVESEVIIYSLGTDSLENIGEFTHGVPSDCGRFLNNNTVNWIIGTDVVSLDLGNKTYQTFPLPHYDGNDVDGSHLTVVTDCLCVIYANINNLNYGVWILDDYGNGDSWNKCFTFTTTDPCFARTLYRHEDDFILQLSEQTAIYSCTSRNLTMIQSGNSPEGIYIESLIWPCP